MTDKDKAISFFSKALKCFNLDSFKVQSSIDMLLIVQPEWFNYLLETKEFGILKDIDGFDFFVCTTTKSGIAFKGELNLVEKNRIQEFEDLYKHFYELDMNSQGDILKEIFPETPL